MNFPEKLHYLGSFPKFSCITHRLLGFCELSVTLISIKWKWNKVLKIYTKKTIEYKMIISNNIKIYFGVDLQISYFCTEKNMQFAAPPMNLCTDNGAMIAWAGLENYRLGKIVKEPIAPRPRWPLTEL